MRTNISPITRLYIATTIVLSLVFLFSWLLYAYFFTQISEGSAVINDTKDQLAMLVAKKEQVIIKKSELKAIAEDMKRVRSVLYDPDNPLSFFQMLETIASTSAVKMDLTLADAKKAQNSKDFLVVVMGDYRGARTFLALIELMPFEVDVKSLRLQKNQVGFAVLPVEIRMSIMLSTIIGR